MIREHIRARVLFLAIVVGFGAVWYAFQSPNPSTKPANPAVQSAAKPSPDRFKPTRVLPPPAPTNAIQEAQLIDPTAISGTVVDQQGEPVAGAEVAAYHPDSGAATVSTLQDGAFAFRQLDSEKRYRVSVVAPHFNEAFVDEVAPGNNEIAFTLEPLSAARGNVVYANSKAAIAEFEIAYLDIPPESDADWSARSMTASVQWTPVRDPNGAFEVPDVQSNKSFAIAARAKGHSSAYVLCNAVEPGAMIEGLVIPLSSGATIAGSVETDRGAPVANATIFLGTAEKSSHEATRSRADGTFLIEDVGAGHFTVSAYHTGHGSAVTTTDTAAGRESRVRLVMPAGGGIEGVVTQAGAPVARAIVQVYSQPGSQQDPNVRREQYMRTESDSSGKFNVGGLGEGLYEVMVELPDTDTSSLAESRLTTTAEVETGKVTAVALAFMPATASATVRVTMDGAAVTEGEVRGVVGTGNGDRHFSGPLNAEGVYRAESLPAGAAYVEVIVNQPRGPLKRAITFSLRDGEAAQHTVDFDAHNGITGRITTLAEGEHAEVIVVAGKADADLSKAEELLAVRHMASGVAEVNEDGTFRVEGLEPGDYTVIAVAFNPDDDAGNPLDSMRLAKESVTLANETLELDLAP
ncbi:MAG: carboxypeptidase regulatory-like domain-containing protein [Candidatus Hydrogenedentes bacterium]|nr:carboxypeptidase regulatory-like domain-containing protein [Candidatus Hydrogenedentota bacterium]